MAYLDSEKLTPEETIDRATHIIDGEFIGVSETSRFNLLVFRPERAIKGSLDEDAKERIYVVSYSELNKNREPTYKEGETYMLCLEKHVSVYYEHDQYVLLEDLVLNERDELWETYHEKASAAAKDASGISEYGVPFISSEDMEEVLEFSTNILVVRIGDVYAGGASDFTVSHHCSIEKTLKGNSNDTKDIVITFFKNTVNIGEEYVVLLADASDTAPVYTLASRSTSVFPVEEAYVDPALAELLG